MISIAYESIIDSALRWGSICFCLVCLPWFAGSVKAQQSYQPPSVGVLPPQDTLDNMRRMVDLVHDSQQRPAVGLTVPSAPALASPASVTVSSTKSTSSSSWADNRGLWKLEFPSGQVCSISKIGPETPTDVCR